MNPCTVIFLILILLVTDKEVTELYSLLGGRPVLLPVAARQKHPFFAGWQHLDWEATQDPGTILEFVKQVPDPADPEGKRTMAEVFERCSYQEELRRRPGCCVLLGEVSGGLCSIDFDDAGYARAFIDKNPWTRKCLRTQGSSRGCNIWVILEGSYPKGTGIVRSWTAEEILAWEKDHPGKTMPKYKQLGEWRADGNHTMIHGIHSSGQPYRRLRDYPPVVLTWADIAWPVGPVYPWIRERYDDLAEHYGPEVYVNDNGSLSLNQPFFSALYGAENHILHEAEENAFYAYNGETGGWEPKTEHKVVHDFGGLLLRVGRELNRESIEKKRTQAQLSSLAKLLKGEVELWKPFQKQEQDAGLVHLKNGMLDLREEPPQLRPFSPGFYSRNPVPVPLDETATCPRFLKELIHSALDPDQAELVQKMAGQLLLGMNLTQRFFILEGTAGGGKSTLVNVLIRLVGIHNQMELRTEHLNKQFEIYNFIGKTLLIGIDVPGNFLNRQGASRIKGLTGGDLLAGEKKQGGLHTVKGDFNVVITCNSRLHIKADGDADAWRRRLIRIVYHRPKPEKVIPRFEEQLVAEEGSGILNWMIAGALKLLAEVKATGSIVLSAAQKQVRDDLLAESDSIREFVRLCITGKGPEERCDLTVDEIVQGYFAYCDHRGWMAKSRKEVEQHLPDLMAEYYRANKTNDIKRPNAEGKETSRKGFRHVAFVEGVEVRGERQEVKGEDGEDVEF